MMIGDGTKKVLEDNFIENDGRKIIVHQTTIEDVQSEYYSYDDIIKDFKKGNSFFKRERRKRLLKIDSDMRINPI